MSEMSVSMATKKFRDFCVSELSGKISSKGWIKIDGSRLCTTCARKRRRTLYAMVSDSSPIYLKCFRASCDLKRFATQDDFITLGFDDMKAISVLMNNSNRLNITSYTSGNRPIIIDDRIVSKEQREYFKKRTNSDLNIDSVFQFRFIPNIYNVIKDNFDEDDEVYSKFMSMDIGDNKLAMTFATDDYTAVSYRHTQKNQKVVFRLNEDTPNNGYTLERPSDHGIHTLVVSEGVFDIINIYKYYAIIPGAKYVATFGFQSMLRCITHHYKQHIDTMEHLIVFLDSDQELPYGKRTYFEPAVKSLIKKLNQELGDDAFKKITFVYNSTTKDFGDMSETITPVLVNYKK